MKIFLKIILLLNIFVIDLFIGYFFIKNGFSLDSFNYRRIAPTLTPIFQNQIINSDCGEDCKKYIEEKIADILQVSPSGTPKITLPAQTKTLNKVRSVSYVPIPGSGSTNNSSDWVNLPSTEFYLDKNDFPGLVETDFEANISLINGNGLAMVRLWDVSHSIAVVGSEVQTSSQTPKLVVSGNLNLWSGKNLYRVQVKSLTADTTIFGSGRLKIVMEK